MSIVFAPLLEEGSKRVHKEEEEEPEDKKFFHTDIENRSSNANVQIRFIILKVSLVLKIILLATMTEGGSCHYLSSDHS